MNEQRRPLTWSGTDYAAEAGHHRALDEWFLDRLRPRPTDVVVDLGCGSGEFTARLADITGEGRVIGIEPDPSMLEAAARHGRANLSFVQARAQDVDQAIDAASVDVVLSRAMLHWLPLRSYAQVFTGVLRVLRPGGWYHSESAGAGNVPRVVELLEDLATKFGVPTPPGFPDAGTVLELLEGAGFELPLEGVRTVAQRRPFTREQAIGFLRTQATVGVTRSAPEEQREALVEAAVSEVDRLRRADGTFDQTFVRLEILARRPDRRP